MTDETVTHEIVGGRVLTTGDSPRFPTVRRTIKVSAIKYIERDVTLIPKATVSILLWDEETDEYILGREYRSGPDREMVGLVSGYVEPDEEPQAAACREAVEEVGYYPRHIRFIGAFYKSPGWNDELVYLYFGRDLERRSLPQDADENVKAYRLPLSSHTVPFLNLSSDLTTALALSLAFTSDFFKTKVVMVDEPTATPVFESLITQQEAEAVRDWIAAYKVANGSLLNAEENIPPDLADIVARSVGGKSELNWDDAVASILGFVSNVREVLEKGEPLDPPRWRLNVIIPPGPG